MCTCIVSDCIYLRVACHSDDQFHTSPFDYAKHEAKLGTNSFVCVNRLKARSLNYIYCLLMVQGLGLVCRPCEIMLASIVLRIIGSQEN